MSFSSKRIFQVSSDMFWGYRVEIDLIYFETIAAIIQYVKNDLKQFLLSRNLQLLAEQVEKNNFHIHHPFETFEDIKNNTNTSTIIYICDHCKM